MKSLLVIVPLPLASTVLELYGGWPRLSAGNTKDVTTDRPKKVK